MSLEEYTHICTLQFTNRDGETLELDFQNEEAALSIAEYIKQNPPLNLETLSVVKNIYAVDHWENELVDEWDNQMKKAENKTQ